MRCRSVGHPGEAWAPGAGTSVILADACGRVTLRGFLGGLVSPILVRPVREQLEHDRVIRLLQTRFRRKYEAAINVGHEQNTAVGVGTSAVYPDLVLQSPER